MRRMSATCVLSDQKSELVFGFAKQEAASRVADSNMAHSDNKGKGAHSLLFIWACLRKCYFFFNFWVKIILYVIP